MVIRNKTSTLEASFVGDAYFEIFILGARITGRTFIEKDSTVHQKSLKIIY